MENKEEMVKFVGYCSKWENNQWVTEIPNSLIEGYLKVALTEQKELSEKFSELSKIETAFDIINFLLEQLTTMPDKVEKQTILNMLIAIYTVYSEKYEKIKNDETD